MRAARPPRAVPVAATPATNADCHVNDAAAAPFAASETTIPNQNDTHTDTRPRLLTC